MARNEEWEKYLHQEYMNAAAQGYQGSDALYDRLAEQAIQRMRERDRERATGEDIKAAYQKKYAQLIMDAMAANAQAMSDKLWSKEDAPEYKITVDSEDITNYTTSVKFNADSRIRPPDFDHYQDALKWAMGDVRFTQQYGPNGRSRAVPVDPKWGSKKDIGGPTFKFGDMQRDDMFYHANPAADPLLRKRKVMDLRTGQPLYRWTYYHDVFEQGCWHYDTGNAAIQGIWAIPFWTEPPLSRIQIAQREPYSASPLWGIRLVDDTGRMVQSVTWFYEKKEPPCDWKNLQVLPKNPVLG